VAWTALKVSKASLKKRKMSGKGLGKGKELVSSIDGSS